MNSYRTVFKRQHQWIERKDPHLTIETGEPVVQHHCCTCGRDVVTVLPSDERHAAYASIFRFYRLSDEVTARWLREVCPGARLPRDKEDRNTRLASSITLKVA